jgi:hypothetical protein
MKKTRILILSFLCALPTLFVSAQDLYKALGSSQLTDISDIQSLPAGEFTEKYELFVTQPIDHNRPEVGTFKQRVFVCHVGFDRPTLIVTEGYGAEYAKNVRYREELSRLFNMNIIVVEYRYFLKSIPSPLNWDYLTVENSMYDLHHIRTLFGHIYKGKWAATGVSKGGQTTMFYRTFFPNDVDVSVPYVAPFNKGVEDGRHEVFIAEKVGTPEERKRVLDFQLEIEKRKPTLMPLFKAHCEKNNYHYRCPVEEIYDYCVMEYSFALWQYGTPINSIPATTADDQTLFGHLLQISDPMYFSYITQYSAFDVQAARELGYYGYDPKPFKPYLTLKTTKDYLRRLMVPDGQENIKFRKDLYNKTRKFLLASDPRMIFIYGSIDPWTASGVTDPAYFKNKANLKCFVEQGGSHRTKIGNMSPSNRDRILRLLSQWLEEPAAQP